MFWFIKQNKNIIYRSFVINWFEIVRAIFQPITFMIKENVGPKGEPMVAPSF